VSDYWKQYIKQNYTAAEVDDLLKVLASRDMEIVSLLAVLRQCLGALSKLYVCTGPMFDSEEYAKEYEVATDESSAALAAAREKLEGEKV